MENFEHGGKIFAAARELNLSIEDIIDFSANINPFVTTEKLKQWSKGAWKKILHYPDVDYIEVRTKIASYHHVKLEEILLGNGAASLIDLIVRAIRPETAMLTAPCFAEYRRALLKQSVNIEELAVDEDLEVDLELFFERAQTADIAFLTSPNNPTGKLLAKTELIDYLILASQQTKTIFVLDEAFIDFSDDGEINSLADTIYLLPNLIILRSLTKFYGIPGLRLGYIICSNQKIIKKIRDLQSIWDINVMATEIAMNALNDDEFYQLSRRGMIDLKKDFRLGLEKIGFFTENSQANYFLIKINDENIYTKLFQRGIIIRRCDNFNGLNSGYYRLAVRTVEQNKRLLESLENIRKLEV